ncbi:MAG: 3-phosphoshikimate 1-carboxyvinyltransferase [Proteobacteria bacterium]|nr:3-phosphoshikimate 1-carboxyvinyltransferase [Pseudomonadota bacterium]
METIGTVHVQAPASKSMSHRAVIAAALASGSSLLHNVLDSDDLTRTMGCLTACGATFEFKGRDLKVVGVAGLPRGGAVEPADLYMHESGTTCRLMTAVAAAGQGLFRVHGAARLHVRPIGALARALASQGVEFTWQGREGYPPLVMHSPGLAGGEISVELDESSQYLSGLLLAAACARSETVINVGGTKVVSWPYVALTLQTLEDFGISFSVERLAGNRWSETAWKDVTGMAPGTVRFRVRPGHYASGERRVEGDWSNASYFLAAGAVGPRPVVVSGLRRDSLQGDRSILGILERMGARISWQDDAVTVAAPESGRLRGLEVDMGDCPDIVPTVAAAACFADGPTLISGVAHLRIKECDRLEGTAGTLRKAGATVQVLDDGLRVTPGDLPESGDLSVTTFGDHRMAMSSALFALAGMSVQCDDPGCVGKSFPTFWDEWNKVVS